MESRGESSRTAELLAELAALRGRPCVRCARAVCGHEALISMALGFKNGARCLACVAAALDEEVAVLRDRVVQHIRRRDCFFHGWLSASELEGFGASVQPPCLWPNGALAASAAGAPAKLATTAPVAGAPAVLATTAPAGTLTADAEWDAGDLGCGELVLELRLRLRAMAPGSILRLTARDPGAPEDLPAWCGMTGHTLLEVRHPDYWIKRREEDHHDG